jgi:hypothetical protein
MPSAMMKMVCLHYGVMYVLAKNNSVVALDAVTGKNAAGRIPTAVR